MKKRALLYIALLFCIISTNLSAQKTKPVRIIGKVVSDTLNTPVPFAFVANSETGIGKETNIQGFFKLDITKNDTILFRSMGYEDDSWAYSDIATNADTLVLMVKPKSYALKEIKVLNFRSYASFRHMVANMEDMAEPSSEPFKIDVRAALAEKKAESGTFGASIRLAFNHIPREEREYKALLAHEKQFERYNKLTSHENLKSFTNLEGAKLDSFIVFLRSKHNIDPKLNDYELMAAINDIYKDFLALQSDTIRISRQ